MTDTLSSAFMQQVLKSTNSPIMIIFPKGKKPFLPDTSLKSKKKNDKLEEAFKARIVRLEALVKKLRQQLREVENGTSQQRIFNSRPSIPSIFAMGA